MKKTNVKGFTIIEVVLVLAIAGLIFLVVFLALPALQRSQRDTARRSSIGSFTSQLNQYQANNKGQIPASDATLGVCGTKTITCFVTGYMKSNWTDPSSNAAYVQVAPGGGTAATAPANPGEWRYVPARICSGEDVDPVAANAKANNFAVQMKLEGAGYICQDNA